jgi:hypothetical protein
MSTPTRISILAGGCSARNPEKEPTLIAILVLNLLVIGKRTKSLKDNGFFQMALIMKASLATTNPTQKGSGNLQMETSYQDTTSRILFPIKIPMTKGLI